MPALTAALTDEDDAVRRAATRAMQAVVSGKKLAAVESEKLVAVIAPRTVAEEEPRPVAGKVVKKVEKVERRRVAPPTVERAPTPHRTEVDRVCERLRRKLETYVANGMLKEAKEFLESDIEFQRYRQHDKIKKLHDDVREAARKALAKTTKGALENRGIRREPPGRPAPPKPAPQAVHKGKTPSQWVHQLRTGDDAARDAAAGALVEMGAASASALAGALEDGDKKVRAYAIMALGQIGPGAKAAVPALVRMLKDRHKVEAGEDTFELRFLAAVSLGEMGADARGAVPALVRMLENDDKAGRMAAMMALARLGAGAEPAVPALIRALEDRERVRHGDDVVPLRALAAGVLFRIGLGAKEAIPALERALDDEDEDVRGPVQEALLRIQTEVLHGSQKPESLEERNERIYEAEFLLEDEFGW